MSYIFGEHPFEKFLKLQAERQRAQKRRERNRGGGKIEKRKSRRRDEMKWNSLIVNDIF